MKLSRASCYAIHAVVHLAQQKGDNPVPSHVIAAARGIPDRFLLKVLKPLVSARVLRSAKGPHGGYELAKDASDISMLDIVEAVEGPIQGGSPLTGNGNGNAVLNGKLDRVCQTVLKALREQLSNAHVSDFLSKK